MANQSAALFAEHHERLLRYLCRAVGHLDDARDLAQDVFVRIGRTEVPAASQPELRAWVFRIARNLVIDYHRQRMRRPSADGGVSVSAQPPSQHVALAVNQALAALPELDRDVFLMREMSGLSYDEIARACELTPDAVRSRIHRARLELRRLLEEPIAAHRTTTMTLSGRTP